MKFLQELLLLCELGVHNDKSKKLHLEEVQRSNDIYLSRSMSGQISGLLLFLAGPRPPLVEFEPVSTKITSLANVST